MRKGRVYYTIRVQSASSIVMVGVVPAGP